MHLGIAVGVPLLAYSLYRPYYTPAPYYYPPLVLSAPAPTVYVEQAPIQPYVQPYVQPQAQPQYQPAENQQAAPPSSWWYYCPDSQAYYPYVRSCSVGWQRVAPQPPA